MQEPQKTLILSHSLRLQVPFDTNLMIVSIVFRKIKILPFGSR